MMRPYKVKELIALLKDQNQESDVLLIDPDTGWTLPIEYIGTDAIHIQETSESGGIVNVKPDTVYIVSNYNNVVVQNHAE